MLVNWIRDLPRHMSEAFGSAVSHFSFFGARRAVLFALLALTVVATALGLTDLIAASEAGGVGAGEMAVVAALATAAIVSMWLALEFSLRLESWPARIFAFLIYLLLVLWSVGFGFGFYWKHLASVGIAQDQTHTMVQRVDSSLSRAEDSLTTIQSQLNSLTNASDARTLQESSVGGACDGVMTGRGEGPYWNLRSQISRDVGGLILGMNAWIGEAPPEQSAGGSAPPPAPAAGAATSAVPAGTAEPAGSPIGNEAVPAPVIAPAAAPRLPLDPEAAASQRLPDRIEALRASAKETEGRLAKGISDPAASRQELLNLSADAKRLIDATNTIIDGKGPYVQALRDFAAKLTNGHYSLGANVCRDSGLAGSLGRAAEALEAIPRIGADAADLDPQLGPRATQHAFARLWRNVFWFMPGKPREPLGERDLQALAAAVVVDICIFFLTVYGRSDDPALPILRVIERPPIGRELRRRLYAFVNAHERSDEVRTLFDSSITLHREQFYLVASEDVPAVYSSIRNLQIILLASDIGAWATVAENGDAGSGDEGLLAAIRRTLANVAREAGADADPSGNPERFARDRISALRLSPEFVFALQGLLSARPADDPAVQPPPRPGPAGREGSAADSAPPA